MKTSLIVMLIISACFARTITDNFAWSDPCKVVTIKDGDTLLRCNLSQADSLTPICASVAGLVVKDCNYFNCSFPKGTKIIGGAGCQKSLCSNDSLYTGVKFVRPCAKNCAHVISTTVVGKDTTRVYTSTVYPAKSPISTKDAVK